MLRIFEHYGSGAAPVASYALTRLPLRHRRNTPFPRRLRGICCDRTGAPDCRDPGGNCTRLQVVVPAIGEVWLSLDQFLVDQILPVGGDLLGLRVIDGDFPGLAIDAEQVAACLPHQPGEPAWFLGWEVGDIDIGIGGMQLRSSISVLRPGGGHRDIILLEEVGPVVHSHGATILWDGVDRIAEGYL